MKKIIKKIPILKEFARWVHRIYLTLRDNKRIKNYINGNSELKIVIGSSGIFENKWCPTDIYSLNLLIESSFQKTFQNKKVNIFLAEHVWEHLTIDDGLIAAKNCYKYLNKGGHMRIAVPDGLHSDKDYIKAVEVDGTGLGSDDHKVLYNYKTLSEVFEKAGFKVELLEYFDENHSFISNEWDKSKGMIHRSSRYDKRNKHNPIKYTSIILDALKD